MRLMREEKDAIEKNKPTKERSLMSLNASLESMRTTATSLNEELGSDLLAQLTVDDQREVDQLNDQIRDLTQENKVVLKERIRVRYRSSDRRENMSKIS